MTLAEPIDVLITTAYLEPGDEVDTRLSAAGLRTRHVPDPAALAPAERARLMSEARAVIAGTQPITAADIAAAERLEIIVRTGVGYDSVDVAAATERGVPVCITAGANRHAVAEQVFALLLASARRLPENLATLARGEWAQPTGRELRGATLGILGLGSIGKAVATIAEGFGMEVVAYDPFFDAEFAAAHGIRRAELDELLRTADFVTLHLFLDDSTRHLIDAARLRSMKSDAVIVNTARGGIVDEVALVEAVRRGEIGGAALDVFATEPLPADSALLTTPGIIVTPHVAGATREARRQSGLMAAQNVIETLAGNRAQFIVNPDVEGVRA